MALTHKKLIKIRMRHAKFISTVLSILPFVRSVLLTGSMTCDRATRHSDIDLLIIVRSGRIFTARFFCLSATWLTGLKRSSDEAKSHAGRICLNYFLTDQFLIIPHNRGEELNKYCAIVYSNTKFLAGDEVLFHKFIKMNESWMGEYIKIQNSNLKSATQISKSAKQWNDGVMKQWVETLLSGRFGDLLEGCLRRIQLKRINNDPRTKLYPSLIVANDQEMRFHPPKINKTS